MRPFGLSRWKVSLPRAVISVQLTRIDFDRMLMQRGDETLPRVLSVLTHSQRTAILFAVGPSQSAMRVAGVTLECGEIVAFHSGLPFHFESKAPVQWGSMSLSEQDPVAAGQMIVERELAAPPLTLRMKPAPLLSSRLLNLHEAVGQLAKAAPDILTKPEGGAGDGSGLSGSDGRLLGERRSCRRAECLSPSRESDTAPGRGPASRHRGPYIWIWPSAAPERLRPCRPRDPA